MNNYSPEASEAKRLAELQMTPAERLRAAGLKMMYHHHAFEFTVLDDGKTMMEHILSMMPSDLMGVTADTYWLQAGGADVCAWLQSHAGRLHCAHLKDYAMRGPEVRMASVGAGNLDFPQIIEILRRNGVSEYALVEQDECYGASPFACLRQSFEYLKNIKKRRGGKKNDRGLEGCGRDRAAHGNLSAALSAPGGRGRGRVQGYRAARHGGEEKRPVAFHHLARGFLRMGADARRTGPRDYAAPAGRF